MLSQGRYLPCGNVSGVNKTGREVKNGVQVGWNRWRNMTGMLCDGRAPQGRAIKDGCEAGNDVWTREIRRMLRFSSGVTRKDNIRTIDDIRTTDGH